MHGPERIVLLVALVLPLLNAGVGWPAFVRWVGGSLPTPSPEVVPTAVTSAATVAATPGASSTLRPATPPAAARVAAPMVLRAPATPAATATRAADAATAAASSPTAAVATFYELVGRHQFDTAAHLWSARMRATFPPQDNIDRRFAQTQQVVVNHAEVVSTNGTQATVAVDLVEVGAAERRHYVGTWSVIRGADGWLLDQPNLQAPP